LEEIKPKGILKLEIPNLSGQKLTRLRMKVNLLQGLNGVRQEVRAGHIKFFPAHEPVGSRFAFLQMQAKLRGIRRQYEKRSESVEVQKGSAWCVSCFNDVAFCVLCPIEAQERVPASQVVWQHVGRIYLNPSTGKAVYAGCVVHLNGISASLFNGAPSEATAFFTFSTDVLSLAPMPNDGDLALYLVSAGTFNVYYNTRPDGDWNNPSTFSNGQLIATFARHESLFSLFTTIGIHSLSETLESTQTFTFNGQALNFKRMVPHGITFAQFFSTTPQTTGLSEYPVAFAAAAPPRR
jgi:hypothetical protein